MISLALPPVDLSLAPVTIWTTLYQPFILGGHCDRLLATVVKPDSITTLGSGFMAYTVSSTTGRTYYVEQDTKGLLGPNLFQIQQDIETATITYMLAQLQAQKERYAHHVQRKSLDTVTPAVFWAKIERKE